VGFGVKTPEQASRFSVHSLGQVRHGNICTETPEVLTPYMREEITPTMQV